MGAWVVSERAFAFDGMVMGWWSVDGPYRRITKGPCIRSLSLFLHDFFFLSHSRHTFTTSALSDRLSPVLSSTGPSTSVPQPQPQPHPLPLSFSKHQHQRPHSAPASTFLYPHYRAMSSRTNKATMHELKLRRIHEHNHRLREELARPRANVSVASMRWVRVGVIRVDPGGPVFGLVQLNHLGQRRCRWDQPVVMGLTHTMER